MKHNEPLSSLTHLIGLLLSIAGLVLLVIFGALFGRASHVVGFSIFGAGLIFLYLASTIYHFISKEHGLKGVFQRIDHTMIYILIAATYTPIALVLPDRAWGWTLFGIIWGLALVGSALKLSGITFRKWLTPVLAIIMGWIGVIALPQLLSTIPPQGMAWLILGGVLYTVGAIFFAFDRIVPRTRWFGMHEIFHLFVMGGSFSHFWFMFKYLLYI